jgi:sodium/proline symporter
LLGGILLAAILSAIMSTIDSQLLVCSSSLTEDFYNKVIQKDAPQRRLVLVGRLSVVLISVVALLLALNPENTVLGLVAYAWAGFGAAFGPLVIFSLFFKKTRWQSALAGMVVGTLVLIIWKNTGLGAILYEIVPGFAANCAAILIGNLITGDGNDVIKSEFEKVVSAVKSD